MRSTVQRQGGQASGLDAHLCTLRLYTFSNAALSLTLSFLPTCFYSVWLRVGLEFFLLVTCRSVYPVLIISAIYGSRQQPSPQEYILISQSFAEYRECRESADLRRLQNNPRKTR